MLILLISWEEVTNFVNFIGKSHQFPKAKSSLLCILSAVMMLTQMFLFSDCPAYFEHSQTFNGFFSCYHVEPTIPFSTQHDKWDVASYMCRQHGGHMATVWSRAENAFLGELDKHLYVFSSFKVNLVMGLNICNIQGCVKRKKINSYSKDDTH